MLRYSLAHNESCANTVGADCVKVLLEAYFYGKSDPVFDYRDIS